MNIRPILNDAELDDVQRLTHDQYVAEGYTTPQPDGRLRYYDEIEAAPENMVLVAIDDGAIVGTVSVTLDGPAGLHVDHDFGAACAAVRAEGPTVGGVWRIVTEPDLRTSRTVILELIRSSTDVLRRFGVSTALCEFAPRHEHVYRKLLGFATVARCEGLGEVRSPAVLMRASVAEAARRLPPGDNASLATLVAERQRLLDVLRRTAA
ncbi:MAG: hypothetical protein IT332_07160 [Ardenticatenales bacterium]|nr:hypothetical protein [Ardenticatenales bacterium]